MAKIAIGTLVKFKGPNLAGPPCNAAKNIGIVVKNFGWIGNRVRWLRCGTQDQRRSAWCSCTMNGTNARDTVCTQKHVDIEVVAE